MGTGLLGFRFFLGPSCCGACFVIVDVVDVFDVVDVDVFDVDFVFVVVVGLSVVDLGMFGFVV